MYSSLFFHLNIRQILWDIMNEFGQIGTECRIWRYMQYLAEMEQVKQDVLEEPERMGPWLRLREFQVLMNYDTNFMQIISGMGGIRTWDFQLRKLANHSKQHLVMQFSWICNRECQKLAYILKAVSSALVI